MAYQHSPDHIQSLQKLLRCDANDTSSRRGTSQQRTTVISRSPSAAGTVTRSELQASWLASRALDNRGTRRRGGGSISWISGAGPYTGMAAPGSYGIPKYA